jgi:hypothetical protein
MAELSRDPIKVTVPIPMHGWADDWEADATVRLDCDGESVYVEWTALRCPRGVPCPPDEVQSALRGNGWDARAIEAAAEL